MNSAADETFAARFNLHYAARVTQRQATLCKRIGQLIDLVSLLAGSSAFVMVVKGSDALAAVAAAVLATVQISQVVFDVSAKAAQAALAAKAYSKALNTLPRDAGAEAIDAAKARAGEWDEVQPNEVVRALAYNDAVLELGAATEHLMPVPRSAWMVRLLC